jgi:hypothetical protein
VLNQAAHSLSLHFKSVSLTNESLSSQFHLLNVSKTKRGFEYAAFETPAKYHSILTATVFAIQGGSKYRVKQCCQLMNTLA